MLRSKNSSSRARATSTNSRNFPSSRGRGRGAASSASTTLNTNLSNPYEKERLENAAKREQNSQESTGISSRGARGSGRGRFQNKTVQFTSPPTQPPKESIGVVASASVATNGQNSSFANLGPEASTPGFTTSSVQLNPFGPDSTSNGEASFGYPSSGNGWNPFVDTSLVKSSQADLTSAVQITNGTNQSSVFGTPSGLNLKSSTQNPLDKPLIPSPAKTSIFGTTSSLGLPSSAVSIKSFSANTERTGKDTSNSFAMVESSPPRNLEVQSQEITLKSNAKPEFLATLDRINTPKNNLANEIDTLLRKHGIVAPPWPTLTPGDPSKKAIIEGFWQSTKAYRTRVRTCLIQEGYLDNPDKPKKLSEAIDFRGTCEEMCPQFEKITRIVEHDVQSAEKELSPDGQTYWPAIHKMVKALARSAAGQDAPLPEDVRSPAALRRTLNYLIDTVLGTNDLPTIHGFLWDRTRAIRRDFVFQQSSISSQELLDQVYCLEQITRFHVVALHQMSREDVIAEDFSEQQEIEQLGKALLSLIHAYEDGKAQGIRCENEAEFRAYYVLLNSHNTGILEAVQDWGWDYWNTSNEIRTAVILVEALQNIWDTQGPLKPHSVTDVAQNAFHRFFSIIENTKVSYTMACFAEIHFNKVRKAALKTILTSYRKQRDQTTDWTLEGLNSYLYFDNERDIVTFGKAYGVHFEILNGQECLSFEYEESMKDPFPQLKQAHSYRLVEHKRGDHTLQDVIHRTVFGETTWQITEEQDDNNSLFIPRRSNSAVRKQVDDPRSPDTYTYLDPPYENSSFLDPAASQSLFREEQTNLLVTKNNNHNETKYIPSPNPGTIASATIVKGDRFSMTDGADPQTSNSKPSGITSISNNTTPLPQQSIFSFLGQTKSAPPNQTFSYNTPVFPQGTLMQADEISSNSTSPTSKPTFQFLEPSASLISSQVIPPLPTSIASSTQLVRESDVVKNVAPKDNQIKPMNKNIQDLKQQSIDPPISKQSRSPGIGASPDSLPKKARMASFTQWIALGQDGLIDQFIESSVENILIKSVKKFVADEKKRRLEEEERKSREEAANYRFKFLATKYFYAWRDVAHRLWMRRRGRLARLARRQMAEESFRTSQASEKRDIVQEFRESGDNRHQNQTQILTPTKDSPSHAAVEYTQMGIKKKNRLSNGETTSQSKNEQKIQGLAFRKSLLSESAYLQGGSRIHLIPNYNPHMDGRRQPNGVKTDYFRLKARGIMTLPDGTPLANTAAVHLSRKLSLDNTSTSRTHNMQIFSQAANSLPSRPVANDILHGGFDTEKSHEFYASKNSVSLVTEEEKQNKRRFLDDDEIELFASAKRVREQMDEEALWMREQVQKSMSRSSS